MRGIWIGIGLATLLMGCGPHFKADTLARLDPALDYATVQANPAQFAGRTLLTGGSILALSDSGEGSLLEIQRWEVSDCGALLAPADSGERLLVQSPSRLSVEEFTVGRLVTLCGRVIDQTARAADHPGETVLALELDEIHLSDTPYRYGLYRNSEPNAPVYLPPRGLGANHPYDPTAWAYPYSPFWYRVR